MSIRYRHTQPGTLMRGVMGLAVLLALIASLAEAPPWFGGAVMVAVLAVLYLVHDLTVTVDDRSVRLVFGPGLVHRTIDLARIEAAVPVRNRWYHGWGIRVIPGGWLYNVSGLDAVELRLRDGGRIRVGTDEPDVLARAVSAAITGRAD